jgi:hypothetical protein
MIAMSNSLFIANLIRPVSGSSPAGSVRARSLRDDKCRSGIQRLEILDVQIVHPDLDGKGLLDERHQLNGEQRVDDAGVEKIVVIGQIGHIDCAQDETLDPSFDFQSQGCGHRLSGYR